MAQHACLHLPVPRVQAAVPAGRRSAARKRDLPGTQIPFVVRADCEHSKWIFFGLVQHSWLELKGLEKPPQV